MAEGTVLHDPSAGPVGDPFAVGAPYPVFFLPEMALTAHLITVIHIDFCPLFSYQKVTLILCMAGKTVQRFVFRAMCQDDITMGHLRGPVNPDLLVVVTVAAFKTLDLVIACFRPEKSALVFCLNQNRFLWNWGDRVDYFLIVKGTGRPFNGHGDSGMLGIFLTAEQGKGYQY